MYAKGEKNGKTVEYDLDIHYYYFNEYDYERNKGIFLTYDVIDAEGKVTTYTATKLEESQVIGDGGYKVIKVREPVLVSQAGEFLGYSEDEIPEEVKEIIGMNGSWLDSIWCEAFRDSAGAAVEYGI